VRIELAAGDDSTPDPHPEWVAAIRPTAAQVMQAAAVLGWYPEVPYLEPARR